MSLTPEEFLDWVVKIGMGWLGYTEAELENTDLNMIMLAYEGKTEMLKACFGAEDKTKPKKKKTPITVNEFKSFAAMQNAVMKGSG